MNTKTLKQFEVMNSEMLAGVEGGKNNWQTNVWECGLSAVAGWGFGVSICAASGVGVPLMGACGYLGAKSAVTLWAAMTEATGGV
ncbi:Blp family class II bacteriocin [Streptococcus dysgalactiae]|uniref:Blp family class II bacteriocin n=1 Tax=Streptococcus dysgalactiae TaxID=1334 RepID=UPI0013FD700A|nr:Blp family class II bacteriocin [Streptococcus dysgalactiae]